MRILLTTDTVGGVWTYAIELARALRPHGVQFALATMGAEMSRAQAEAAAQLPNVRVYSSAYKLEWMEDPWDDVARAGDWLLEIERDFEPDVVHLNGYAHGQLPFRAPVMVVAHSCVLSWWEAVKGEAAPASWDRYRAEVSAGLAGADLIVAPSEAMRAAIVRHYAPGAPSMVIHNGRDSSEFCPNASKENLIFAAGRVWDEAKNIVALGRVAGRLEWPVYVAGDSRQPGRTHGIEISGLHLLGLLDQTSVWNWMSRASIYALPARYEPFGLSVLEAALSGCALVLGDIPSLRELWQDAAIFVPPSDQEKLAVALGQLIEGEAERRRLAETAQRRAKRFSALAMGRAYARVQKRLVDQRNVRAKDSHPVAAAAGAEVNE